MMANFGFILLLRQMMKLFTELDALGKVAYLISPNKIHYAYIADWKQRYPHAQAWSSPGVEERAKKSESQGCI